MLAAENVLRYDGMQTSRQIIGRAVESFVGASVTMAGSIRTSSGLRAGNEIGREFESRGESAMERRPEEEEASFANSGEFGLRGKRAHSRAELQVAEELQAGVRYEGNRGETRTKAIIQDKEHDGKRNEEGRRRRIEGTSRKQRRGGRFEDRGSIAGRCVDRVVAARSLAAAHRHAELQFR